MEFTVKKFVESAIPFNIAKTLNRWRKKKLYKNVPKKGGWEKKKNRGTGWEGHSKLIPGTTGCWFLGLQLRNNCESFQFIESFCRSDESYSSL